MNWIFIQEDLKALEKRIDLRLEKLISQNLDPFPFDRLKKGKELRSLSRAIQMMINKDQMDDARYLLDILKEKGVKLKAES